jgi:hypothetical protein
MFTVVYSSSPEQQNSTNACIPTPSPQLPTANSFGIDSNKCPTLSKVASLIADEWDETTQETLFLELTRTMKDSGYVIDATDHNFNKTQRWIHVPVNKSENGYDRDAKKWFGEALKWNGGGEEEGEDNAAYRACKYLAKHYPEPMMSALKDKKYPIVDPMSETQSVLGKS